MGNQPDLGLVALEPGYGHVGQGGYRFAIGQVDHRPERLTPIDDAEDRASIGTVIVNSLAREDQLDIGEQETSLPACQLQRPGQTP
jgi:hypothetical protein